MSNKAIGFTFGGVTFAMLALIVYASIQEGRVNRRMFDQCLADGQKEYACHAMLYGRGSR